MKHPHPTRHAAHAAARTPRAPKATRRRTLFSAALALLLLLTACFEGVVTHFTGIEDLTGKGQRRIEIKIYRDGALSPDNSGDQVNGNRNFLPNGGKAAYDAVAAAKPADWDWLNLQWVTAEEEGRSDYDSIVTTMAFDSLEDYNSKGATVAGDMPFTPAILYKMGNEAIYRERLANVRSQLEWILSAIYGENGENPGVFSASQNGLSDPITKDEMIKYLEVTVDLMGETVTLHPPFDRPGQTITVIKQLGDVNTSRPDLPDTPPAGQDLLVRQRDRGGFEPAGFHVERNDAWTELFQRREGWLGADGIFSIPLDGKDGIGDGGPSTRTFFTFADTTIGQADDQLLQFRLGWRMVNQSAALLEGTDPDPDAMTFYYKKKPGTTQVENLYPDSAKTWPSDGIVIDNTVRMLAQKVDDQMNPLEIRELSVPIVNGVPDWEQVTNTPRPDLYYSDGADVEITFTNGIYDNTVSSGAPEPDGFLYVYGFRNIRSEALKQLVVARVPKAEFSNPDAWRFYDGSTWADKITALTDRNQTLADHVSPEISVTYVPDGPLAGKYLLIYQHDTISPYIVMRTADSLTGPFSEARWLYTIPEQLIYNNLPQGDPVTYNTKAHPHLSKPGTLLLSYNVNVWFGLPMSTEIYRPRFLTLDLSGKMPELMEHADDTTDILLGPEIKANPQPDDSHLPKRYSMERGWEMASLKGKSLAASFDSPQRFDRWRVRHASYDGLPTVYNTRSYALMTSIDGKNWTVVDYVTGNTEAETDRVIPSTRASHVKLVILEDAQSDEPVARIADWELFGREALSTIQGPDTLTLTVGDAFDGNAETIGVTAASDLGEALDVTLRNPDEIQTDAPGTFTLRYEAVDAEGYVLTHEVRVTVEAGEPTPVPTEPAEPTSVPTEPAEPTPVPTEPAEPTPVPTEPAEPTSAPTEPSEPTAVPTEPAEPTSAPTEPSEPTVPSSDVTEPAEPTSAPSEDPDEPIPPTPDEPTAPSSDEPTVPSETEPEGSDPTIPSDAPTEPVEPTEPAGPTEPTAPDDTDPTVVPIASDTVDPIRPTDASEAPDEPETPDEPVTPDDAPKTGEDPTIWPYILGIGLLLAGAVLILVLITRRRDRRK